jgi:hypothetical protein
MNEAAVHKRRVCLWLFILFLIFNIGDYVLTILSVKAGASEMNPLAQYFITRLGLEWGIFGIKLLSSISGLAIYIICVLGSSSKYVSDNINPNFTYRAMLAATVIMGFVNVYQICNYLTIFS